jgi:predicted enzyme related to lactoylglutathione lyase
MSAPVVFAEVHGADGATLRRFYGELFGWAFSDMPGPMDYGMAQSGEGGIGVGVGAAPEGRPSQVTFYVRTDDVAGALATAERLGGSVSMPATTMPDGTVLGMVADPEDHVIGLVTPPSGAA